MLLYLALLAAQFAAGLAFYLGFVPVTLFKDTFFRRYSVVAAWSWVAAASVAGTSRSIDIGLAMLCAVAARNFSKGDTLNGKVWLSLISSLGITGGILFNSLGNPSSLPTGTPTFLAAWFIAGVYAGAVLLTSALVSAILVAETKPGSSKQEEFIRKTIWVIAIAAGARAAHILLFIFLVPAASPAWGQSFVHNLLSETGTKSLFVMRLILGIVVPLILCLLSLKASPLLLRKLIYFLTASVVAGEILARMCQL